MHSGEIKTKNNPFTSHPEPHLGYIIFISRLAWAPLRPLWKQYANQASMVKAGKKFNGR